jgi:hypothetical protein
MLYTTDEFVKFQRREENRGPDGCRLWNSIIRNDGGKMDE